MNNYRDPRTRTGTSGYSLQTDIERIQAEIARDLNIPETTIEDTWDDATSEPDLTASYPVSPFTSAGFYRETVKEDIKSRRSWARTVVVVLLICTIGTATLGFGLGASYIWFTNQSGTPVVMETADNSDVPTITSSQYIFEIAEERQSSGTVADMVQMLEPAVVSITTVFESPTGPRPRAGSGTIFAEDEDRVFIATGHYVTAGGSQINVRISDSEPIPARLIHHDHTAGLAVIAVYKSQLLEAGIDNIVIATFGDSSLMQVGDIVFAIGNARNEGTSVTRGIISAGKQELVMQHYNITVLQTDAAINYGNSGGPLVNIRGEVIGINIDRVSAQFAVPVEGIGYSIASNMVVPILNELIDFNRPGIGIQGRTLDEYHASYWGIPAMGVLVMDVAPGRAAYLAGMQQFDVITAFDGEPVFTMEELQHAIRQRRIDDVVPVRILRNGDTPLVLEVRLQALIQ